MPAPGQTWDSYRDRRQKPPIGDSQGRHVTLAGDILDRDQSFRNHQ